MYRQRIKSVRKNNFYECRTIHSLSEDQETDDSMSDDETYTAKYEVSDRKDDSVEVKFENDNEPRSSTPTKDMVNLDIIDLSTSSIEELFMKLPSIVRL